LEDIVEYRNFITIHGNPNAGKTTLANHLKALLPDSIIVSTDSIIVQEIQAGRIEVSGGPEVYGRNLQGLFASWGSDIRQIIYDSFSREIADAASTKTSIIAEGYHL
jgi:adenylate kinase family enzyme